MLLKKSMIFYMLILINIYSLASEDYVSGQRSCHELRSVDQGNPVYDQQAHYELNFFRQYFIYLNVALRVRENILLELAQKIEDSSEELGSISYKNLQAKMLDGFDKHLNEHKEQAEQVFFRQYVLSIGNNKAKNRDRKIDNVEGSPLFSLLKKISKLWN